MYEAEVNNAVESIETLPLDIRKRFAEFRDQVTARTTLPWGEHCTECVWPTCYTTCELYSPRNDGACRQFVDGMVRIDHKEGLSPYLLKIRFKQWGKLWTVGNLHLQTLAKAARQEWFNMAIGAVGRNVPAPASIKPRVLTKISYLKRQSAENAPRTEELPDCFLLECYNPNAHNIALTLTFRPSVPNGSHPFQKMVGLSPGYTRARVAFSEISQSIDTNQRFEVEIVPNGSDDTVLYFGLMDFVKEQSEAQEAKSGGDSKPGQLKCLVWDLDNTLWDGILVEDGPEKIRIRQGVLDVIRQTDERGILHSIASKNNHDDAMKILRRHGVEQYFLYPQIQWQPKSQSIAQIAQALNIGVDAMAFVDDQPFERAEVKAVLPQVVVIDAVDYEGIPDLPACRVPVTAESASRRSMYREQVQRNTALGSHQGDYLGFLRDCRMQIGMRPLDDSNLKRVYELAQRTNQLNFSGNRYQEAKLVEIMNSAFLETYAIDCSDRFGNYGIVGFGVVDTRTPILLDLMFSCRVQGKRVEHAVLSFLLKRFVSGKKQDLHANYRRTSKNAPGGKVFEEVGFEQTADNEGMLSLVFRHGREILDDQIIAINAFGAYSAVSDSQESGAIFAGKE
jgi:FkbH-like protein